MRARFYILEAAYTHWDPSGGPTGEAPGFMKLLGDVPDNVHLHQPFNPAWPYRRPIPGQTVDGLRKVRAPDFWNPRNRGESEAELCPDCEGYALRLKGRVAWPSLESKTEETVQDMRELRSWLNYNLADFTTFSEGWPLRNLYRKHARSSNC